MMGETFTNVQPSAPKGASTLRGFAISLKRYPDTNLDTNLDTNVHSNLNTHPDTNLVFSAAVFSRCGMLVGK